MAIEDRVDEWVLYATDNSSEYYKWMLSDIKKWIQRYCKECGSVMKISTKWKPYCSSICWDKDIEIQNYYQQWVEEFIYNNY